MKAKFANTLLVLILLLSSMNASSQDSMKDYGNSPPGQKIEQSNENTFPEPVESTEVLALPMSRLEFQLSLTILIFGILLILLEIYVVRIKNISSEETIKLIVITIIIISTLFLITAGYSNDQIAPAVGLLGTIAGYLLGRISSSNQNQNEKV